jgi:hypothetical protein
MDLSTKAGGLLGLWEAVITIGMVAMVTIEPFGGKETSEWQFLMSSWIGLNSEG